MPTRIARTAIGVGNRTLDNVPIGNVGKMACIILLMKRRTSNRLHDRSFTPICTICNTACVFDHRVYAYHKVSLNILI